MKKNYDENYIPLKKENELLKEQNHQLKSELFKLNKNSQFFNNYVDKDLVLLTRVSDLDVSSRLLSIFRHTEIETLGDIVGYSKRDFIYFRNFGKKSLLELETLLEKYGLKLNKMD
jgi:DNA-directed RNA polymerase alpha subunit